MLAIIDKQQQKPGIFSHTFTLKITHPGLLSYRYYVQNEEQAAKKKKNQPKKIRGLTATYYVGAVCVPHSSMELLCRGGTGTYVCMQPNFYDSFSVAIIADTRGFDSQQAPKLLI